jgi:hypothetical protein
LFKEPGDVVFFFLCKRGTFKLCNFIRREHFAFRIKYLSFGVIARVRTICCWPLPGRSDALWMSTAAWAKSTGLPGNRWRDG